MSIFGSNTYIEQPLHSLQASWTELYKLLPFTISYHSYKIKKEHGVSYLPSIERG